MKTKDDYLTFLRSKIPQAELCGFEPPSPPHPSLFPHQRDVCEWAIRGGRRALFEAFGMGKLPSGFMLFPAVSRNADIWTDISRMRTLNSEQSRRNQEMHVCPLQLDIIKRLITRYTMPGETVYDPFGGIGSVPYQALMMGRNAVMTELNRDYWKAAVGYCERAEATEGAPTLFDMMQPAPEVAA